MLCRGKRTVLVHGSLPLLCLALFLHVGAVDAQVEIGLDAELVVDFDDENAVGLVFPTGSVRVGLPLADHFLVESTLAFLRLGSIDRTQIHVLPGLTWLLSARRQSFYVRAEAGLNHSRGSELSVTQFGFGGAAGFRFPVSDSAVLRVEGGAVRWLEDSDSAGSTTLIANSQTLLRVVVGLSFILG